MKYKYQYLPIIYAENKILIKTDTVLSDTFFPREN